MTLRADHLGAAFMMIGLVFGGAGVQAQPAPAPVASDPAPASAPALPANEAAAPPSTDCGQQGGLYAGPKGFRMWVTRRGTLTQENPLRPLTKDRFVVLQIVVNNRVASAYGPDYDNMMRAGAPQDSEPGGERRITWEPNADALPRSIRVVAEDGALVLGPIVFESCGEAPKVAAPPPVARTAPRRTAPAASGTGQPGEPRRAARPGQGASPRVGLPQGALPEGALPRNAIPQGAIP